MSNDESVYFNAYQNKLPFIMRDFERLKDDLQEFKEITIISANIETTFQSSIINLVEKIYPSKIKDAFYQPSFFLSIHVCSDSILRLIKYLQSPHAVARLNTTDVYVYSLYSYYIQIFGTIEMPVAKNDKRQLLEIIDDLLIYV